MAAGLALRIVYTSNRAVPAQPACHVAAADGAPLHGGGKEEAVNKNKKRPGWGDDWT
jgi:hypothetical protein